MLSIKIFILFYILWNTYAFLAMGNDKRRAKRGQWRISEASLLLMGLALGGIGVYTGMKVYHHKTAHAKFVIGVPLLIVVNFIEIGLLYYVFRFLLINYISL